MSLSADVPALARTLWLTGIALLSTGGVAHAQVGDFKIVWVVIGDMATSADDQPARAGKHLFMASDLADLSLKQVKIARIDAEPTVTPLHTGDRFCLSSLRIVALAPDGAPVRRAPLSISVRQDHRDALQLERSDRDICVRPRRAGEYTVRLASLLPAPDGSMRGAQIYLRVAQPLEQESSRGPSPATTH